MKLQFKKLHPDAIIPRYATKGAACFDLHAIDVTWGRMMVDSTREFRTGLAVEIPEGYAMLIYSRSGHGFKYDTRLSNCVGVIDSDYRGEIKVKLSCDWHHGEVLYVHDGDRIAQAMIVPAPQWQIVEADELSDTERGTGGFGSTGA